MLKLWFVGAFIFALLAVLVILGILPELSFGAMVFAMLGCGIYGGVLPLLYPNLNSWWYRAWHLIVAFGIVEILLDGGSGIWSFPFSLWLGVPITCLLGIIVFQQQVNWLQRATAMAVMVVLIQLLSTNGLGVSGVLAAMCLGATLISAMILILVYRFLGINRGEIGLSIPILLAPIFGGGMIVEGMPVWWIIPELWRWWGVVFIVSILWAVILSFRNDSEQNSWRPNRLWGGAIFVILLLSVVLFHYQDGHYEVKRPAADDVGAQIYAREGCAICHTQMIRRMDGVALQAEIDRNQNPDFEPRYTELGDLDTLRNREGAAQVGLFPIGPDLSNLAEFVEQRLEYEDVVTGELKRSAHIREWLALHLYNPKEKMLGQPDSICLRGERFFALEQDKGQKNGLPVKVAEGDVLVSNERGEHILNYLESLSRREVVVHTPASRSTISPEFAKNPPLVDRSRLETKKASRMLEKGRAIYLNKCAICHGNDGKGDSVNYPPLAGSEWLSEKSDLELVDIIRNGLSGKISVAGKDWDSKMLPPGVHASKDIAELLTFLRQYFGKVNRNYTPEEIDKLRKNEEGF